MRFFVFDLVVMFSFRSHAPAWECIFTVPNQPHFMTLTVLNWLPIFTRLEVMAVVFNYLCNLQFVPTQERGNEVYQTKCIVKMTGG